jgi:hypothetical protein
VGGGAPDVAILEFVSAKDVVAHLTVTEEPTVLPLLPAFPVGPAAGFIPELGVESWDDSLYGLALRLYGDTGAALRIDDVAVAVVDGELSVRLRFNRDVGASLDKADVALTIDGSVVDASRIEFSYDAMTFTGTWMVSDVPKGTLRVELDGNAVSAAPGEALDGDGDGAAGGMFVHEAAIPTTGAGQSAPARANE